VLYESDKFNVICVIEYKRKYLHNFFKILIYCSEIYKCLHEFSIKTVSDTSLIYITIFSTLLRRIEEEGWKITLFWFL